MKRRALTCGRTGLSCLPSTGCNARPVQLSEEEFGELVEQVVARFDVASIHVLKTFDPPVSSLQGLEVTGATRFGKFLDLDVSGLHLVAHLSRAGWLHWRASLPTAPPKPGKGPLALRVHLASRDGANEAGFDLTEQGTQKRLA